MSFDHIDGASAYPAEAEYHYTNLRFQAYRLYKMRSICRYFLRELSYGQTIARAYINGLIGQRELIPHSPSGLSSKPAGFDELVEDWIDWTMAPSVCDYYSENNLLQLLSAGVHHLLCDGEMFYRVRAGSPLRLEPIDPIRVPLTEQGVIRHDSVMGVVYNERSQKTGYLIHKKTPITEANVAYSTLVNTISKTRILHWKPVAKIHSPRGIPLLWQVAALASNTNSFGITASKNAEIVSKRVAVIERQDEAVPQWDGGKPAEEDEEETDGNNNNNDDNNANVAGQYSDDLEMSIATPPAGTKIEVGGAQFPQDVETFLRPFLQQIAASIGLSAHALSGDTKSINFSAGRLGRLEQDQTMSQLHRNMVSTVLQPLWMKFVYRWYLQNQNGSTVNLSKEDIRYYTSLEWRSPALVPTDPKAQAQADDLNLKNKITSHRQIIESMGLDYDTIVDEIKEAEELGFYTAAPEAAESEEDGEPDDEEDADDENL